MKAWYTSRTVWGGIGAMLAGIGPLFGLHVDSDGFVELAISIVSLISGAVAIWGRLKANSPIYFTRTRPHG